MRCIPRTQLLDGDFEQLVGLRATCQSNSTLTNLIATQVREDVHPGHIVQATDDQASPMSVSFYVTLFLFFARRGGGKNVHGDACNDVRSIPKRYVALATRRRIPRHNNQVHIHQDVEGKDRIPDLERGSREPQTLAMVAHDHETHGHCDFEERVWVDLQVNNEAEGVAGRRCDNHDDSDEPFGKVRAKRCAKGARGRPEAWVREHTLSVGNSLAKKEEEETN